MIRVRYIILYYLRGNVFKCLEFLIYNQGFPANDMREEIHYSDRIRNLAEFDWRVESHTTRTNGHNFGNPEVTVSYRERAKIAPCLPTSSFGAIDMREGSHIIE